MRERRQCLCWAGVVLGLIVALSGCTSAAISKLSLDEQAEFHLYRKVMTAAQERAYLAKASAAERMAYLREIGLAQRFQALDPLDREAVLGGVPRVGISAESAPVPLGEPLLYCRRRTALRPLVLPGFVARAGGIWQSVPPVQQSCGRLSS
jgi:hypothetical protein